MSEMAYLRYVVGGGLVKPEEAKVLAVKDFPVLYTSKRFEHSWGWFATTESLCQILLLWLLHCPILPKKQNTVFTWNSESEKAFNSLGTRLA